MANASQRTRFGLALVLQVALIFALVALQATVFAYGTPLLLRVAPIDPTDPIRGDYLSYRLVDFSQIPTTMFGTVMPRQGNRVYVGVEERGEWYAPKVGSIGLAPPRDGTPYLAGRVVAVTPSEVSVSYGIEQIYVPQGSARTVALRAAQTPMYLHAMLGSDGRAVAQNLIVNGQRVP